MRIVIDMQGAQTESRFRGIGRYAMGFARGVVQNRGEHEVFLALSGLFPDTIESIRTAFDGLLPQENIRVWQAPRPVMESISGNNVRRDVAEFLREAFLASLKPDVIHITSLFEGYVDDAVSSIGRFDRRSLVSVTLHDLIPLLNPEHYLVPNPVYEQYYQRKITYLKQAASLLANSEFSRQEGLEYLGMAESRVVNVSTAIEPHFKPISINEKEVRKLYQKFGLTRPFVLYTGGADERKNLLRLIQAYAALSSSLRQELQLLFAGKMTEMEKQIFKQEAKSVGLSSDELCFTGYVSDEDLVQLYNHCKIYVFPSWHEGFGLPALEAMACGAPVIGANTSSLPEVIGLAEALFDPLDVKAITLKMIQALEDEEFRVRLKKHGLERAKMFSWDETAKRAIEVWAKLMAAHNQQPKLTIKSDQKPRLAFVSPMPPERTGIADYSAELLPALSEYYNIELVVLQDQVVHAWSNQNIGIHDVAWLKANVKDIDRVVYQMGNSPFHSHMLALLEEIPGTVVLHDFFMSGLMAWSEQHAGVRHAWTKALYEAHGYKAVQARFQDAKQAKHDYPVNWHILQHAQEVIVHSNYSLNLVEQWYGSGFSDSWSVIPHLRSPAGKLEKNRARKQLGFKDEDFVICSFGFLDASKLNHQLLAAWLNSALANDERCHLVFVGENEGGNYGASLLQSIRNSRCAKRIKITGFASPENFESYLMAADLAVQLRSASRGETSGTVLDCMNHSLPVIVNANGSMAELDAEAFWKLPDKFEDVELIEALETLWGDPEKRRSLGEYARLVIHNNHSPQECARRYAEVIERCHSGSEMTTQSLIRSVSEHGANRLTNAELINLASSIATNLPLVRPAKRLFLDVTATFRNDLKAGIDRVARAFLLALLEVRPVGYRIEPVYMDYINGKWCHRYARNYTLGLLECPSNGLDDDVVEPVAGDVFLGLDLTGDMLVQAQKAGLFLNYRNIGIPVYFMVHDLLPIRMPEVFPPNADQSHARWINAVSNFDGVICVSKAVANDFARWQKENGFNLKNRRPFRIEWLHLGADVVNSAPILGLPENSEEMLAKLKANPSFLMVGTIEPRKGHLQTINTFTELWKEGLDVNLVLVGREGWKGLPEEMRRNIPETIQAINNHTEINKHLFWLEGISDEYLEKVYAASTCLIAASYGEGFGLPVIEAAQHKLPIIARDIPVFHEVAGTHAFYFNGEDASELAESIREWLGLYAEKHHPISDNMPWQTWQESAKQLLSIVLNGESRE